MSPERIGPLLVHVAGGDDRRGGGDGPAILLCHGFGAPGDDLVSLSRVIDAGRGVRWFFPEAPLSLDVGMGMPGRAWWPIDMARLVEQMSRGRIRDLAQETPPGLAEARAALEATIAELGTRFGVVPERLLVGGFSQGAMVTTELSLFAERPFAGLVALSGTLLSEDRWTEAAAGVGPSMHALITHGQRDPVLPFSGAEALRDLLHRAGADVQWVPHGGQHEIPQVAAAAFAAFARARLGGGTT